MNNILKSYYCYNSSFIFSKIDFSKMNFTEIFKYKNISVYYIFFI